MTDGRPDRASFYTSVPLPVTRRQLTHVPLVRDTFLTHHHKLAEDFDTPSVLHVFKWESPNTSQSAGLLIDVFLYSLNCSANTGDVTQGLTTALDLQEPPVSDLRGQGAQMVLSLKNPLYQHVMGARGSVVVKALC
jgi:hypothetical protein